MSEYRPSADDLPRVEAGDTLTFDREGGGEQGVIVESAEWIGEGAFGVIYHVRCRVAEILGGGEAGQRSAVRDCVMKCFLLRGDALRAQRNHELLRRNALPVFPTYQRETSPMKEIIMMPDGNADGVLTVSQNSSLARGELERQPLTEIDNFTPLLAEIASHICMASHFGISLPFDAYFFFVRRQGSGASVGFSFDDTDNVEQHAFVGRFLVAENVRGAIDALRCFLSYAVTPEKMTEYMASASAFLEERGREILAEISRADEC